MDEILRLDHEELTKDRATVPGLSSWCPSSSPSHPGVTLLDSTNRDLYRSYDPQVKAIQSDTHLSSGPPSLRPIHCNSVLRECVWYAKLKRLHLSQKTDSIKDQIAVNTPVSTFATL